METGKTEQAVSTSSKLMLKEVTEGLSQPQKTLLSKYFYDERGSELFEAICELDEYYLSRTEIQIMQDNIDEIMQALGSGIRLIEPGSGNSRKTRLLLDYLTDVTGYIPVEISEAFLTSVVDQLSFEYPELHIQPVVADYTHPFELPPARGFYSKNIVFYPGSTIGNFTPARAQQFLGMISELTEEKGELLIGIDLKKDPKIIEAAYNDAAGVTALFNKNLLVRLNRDLGTNFDINKFKHRAIYNSQEGRIEMHLVSLTEQLVKAGRTEFQLKKGEYIHTENSYKYSLEEFEKLAAPYFQIKKVWTDKDNQFSVQYLTPK